MVPPTTQKLPKKDSFLFLLNKTLILMIWLVGSAFKIDQKVIGVGL